MKDLNDMPDNFDWVNHSDHVIPVEELIVTDIYHEAVKRTWIKTIEYIILNPQAIEVFNTLTPFNSPLVKGIDWSLVKGARFEDNNLIIEYGT